MALQSAYPTELKAKVSSNEHCTFPDRCDWLKLVGRSKHIKPPPPAGSGSVVIALTITASQLEGWARDAGLTITCADIERQAERISERLEWYPLWALIEERREAPTPIKDWCNQVSQQAGDLLFALGLERTDGRTESYRNALLHLTSGWDQRNDDDRHVVRQLTKLAMQATPDRMHLLSRPDLEVKGREAFGNAGYERLGASLRLIGSLADRAAAHHAEIKIQGGKGRGRARLDLFVDLSLEYRKLFGALPTIVRMRRGDDPDSYRNSGASWRFFRLLLGHVETVAKHALSDVSSTQSEENRTGWQTLLEVSQTAHGMAGEGDPLSHLIRKVAKDIKASEKRSGARADAVNADPGE